MWQITGQQARGNNELEKSYEGRIHNSFLCQMPYYERD